MTLTEMFPTKSLPYLRQKISSRGAAERSLPDLIEELLLDQGGEDQDQARGLEDSRDQDQADVTLEISTSTRPEEPSEDPRPGSSKSREPQVHIQEDVVKLRNLFPDLSPVFLQEKARQIAGDSAALQLFVEETFQRKSSLPSRLEWEREEELKVKVAEVKRLRSSDFLEEFEDPLEHYSSTARPASELYALHSQFYLMEKFAKTVPGGATGVQDVLNKNNNLLYPSVKELEKLSKGKGKGLVKKGRALTALPRKPEGTDLTFGKEYVFMKLEGKIRTMMSKQAEKRAATVKKARKEGKLFQCPICYDEECLLEETVQCSNGCLFCPDCVKRGAKVQIGENKAAISCLLSCGENIPTRTLEQLLPRLIFSKLMERQQAEEIKAAGIDNLVQCPACSFAIITDPGDRILTCGNSECARQTCLLCGEKSHIPLTCDEVEKDEEVAARTKVEMAMSEAMIRECVNPKCRKKFFKTEGCNKMKCECGQSMCYLCRKPVEDNYKHFYGQGGTPKAGLCPLWSNNNDLHGKEVKEAAEKVKKTGVGKNLKFDPTKGPQFEEEGEDSSEDSDEDDYDEDFDEDFGGDFGEDYDEEYQRMIALLIAERRV